jgi:hypothetical protein
MDEEVVLTGASSLTAGRSETSIGCTGCADALIRLFRGRKATEATSVFKGHTQPVRALTRLAADRFVSAGNDGSIRLWSLAGDAIFTLPGHDAFIYSLATLPDGSLVSCGEDRSVRVWSGKDGECEQVIVLPAVTVWSVATTPKGDIVAGASDNIVRVFTRQKDRMADEAALRVRRLPLHSFFPVGSTPYRTTRPRYRRQRSIQRKLATSKRLTCPAPRLSPARVGPRPVSFPMRS